MVSYRTILFGTIAVISATSPALASGGHALPGPSKQTASIAAASGGGALPGPSRQTVTAAAASGGGALPGPVAFLNALLRDAESVLHINH